MPFDFSKKYTPREFAQYILEDSHDIPYPTFSNQLGHVAELIRIDRQRQYGKGYYGAIKHHRELIALVNALQMIIDLGFDRDGLTKAEDLGNLVDSLVQIARDGLAGIDVLEDTRNEATE